jgi:hypothetical protein
MASRIINIVTMGVGTVAGYAAASNIKIPSDLKTKYLACAAGTSALGMLVAGGATMPGSVAAGATIMGAGVILAVPVTLLAYTTGYQVGKIAHAVKPAMLPTLASCDPSAQPAVVASGGPTSPAKPLA